MSSFTTELNKSAIRVPFQSLLAELERHNVLLSVTAIYSLLKDEEEK